MSGFLGNCLPVWRSPKPATPVATSGTLPASGSAGALPSGRSVETAPPETPRAPRRSVWSAFTSFVSRQFQAVTACFGRRDASARADSLDASGPAQARAPDGAGASAAANASATASASGANSSPAANAPVVAGSPPVAGPAAIDEQQPARELALGDKVLWKPSYGSPKAAIVTGLPNERSAAIEVEVDGKPRNYVGIDRAKLHPWTEAAQRVVDEAAEAETTLAPTTAGSSSAAGKPQSAAAKPRVPPLPNIPRTRADAVAAHAAHFPPVTTANVASIDANHKVGSYVKLGVTDPATITDAFGNWTGTSPDEQILQQHENVLRALPDRDMQLIHGYVNYCGDNREMRSGKVSDVSRSLSGLLHRISLPLPAGMELKRNLSKFADKEALRSLQPGTIIQSPQFDSLQLPSGNYGEPGHLTGKTDHEVQLRLVTGEGVRGIYIGKSSILETEQELLLAENTRYAIKSVGDDPTTGKLVVEAIVLPTVQGTLE